MVWTRGEGRELTGLLGGESWLPTSGSHYRLASSGFPGSSVGTNLPASAGDTAVTPGREDPSPGGTPVVHKEKPRHLQLEEGLGSHKDPAQSKTNT